MPRRAALSLSSWPTTRDPASLKRAALSSSGLATACVFLLAVIWYAAFHVGILEHADRAILRGFEDLHRPRVDAIAKFIATLCNPKPYVYFAVVPVLVAVARRRPRTAVAVGAILLGANVTTHMLKPLLAQTRIPPAIGGLPPIAPASWPSGHATAAMSLALCSVLAAPSRLRPLVAALGAVFAVAVSYSFLTLGWHYPSDVLGGYLVAATWTLLAAAAVFAADARYPRRTSGERLEQISIREALAPPAAAALGALVLAGLIVLARPHAVVAYARLHEPFMIGAAAIGALGLMVVTGVMLVLRR